MEKDIAIVQSWRYQSVYQRFCSSDSVLYTTNVTQLCIILLIEITCFSTDMVVSNMTHKLRTMCVDVILEPPTWTDMEFMYQELCLDAKSITSVLSLFSFSICWCIQASRSTMQFSKRFSVISSFELYIQLCVIHVKVVLQSMSSDEISKGFCVQYIVLRGHNRTLGNTGELCTPSGQAEKVHQTVW